MNATLPVSRGMHFDSLVPVVTVSTTISFRFIYFLVIRKFGLSFAEVVVVVVVVVISQQGYVLCWDVGSNTKYNLDPPPKSYPRINGWKRATCVTNTCVKGRRGPPRSRAHRSSFVFKESCHSPRHATPSCRTGGSGAPYSTHDRRRHSATGDWGDNKQASNKQQTSKQTPNPQSTTLIFSSYHSYIHTNQ